jgi:hypothetical protein
MPAHRRIVLRSLSVVSMPWAYAQSNRGPISVAQSPIHTGSCRVVMRCC